MAIKLGYFMISIPVIIVGMVTLNNTDLSSAEVAHGYIVSDSTSAQPLSPRPTGDAVPGVGWTIRSTSGLAEIQLARHLTQIGATEYIAWWCPHCHEQKELFGKEAYSKIKHIDCDPQGKDNPRPDLCRKAGIQAYPTWEMKGKLYPGVQRLEKLVQLSGYKGPRNFKNFPNDFK